MDLFQEAMRVREFGRSSPSGSTKVGCAVIDENGMVAAGCNVIQWLHTSSVHAEVNAITNLISQGGGRVVRVAIVADRELFTPCGGCRDWLMEFGGPDCAIHVYHSSGKRLLSRKLKDLIPYYPH